MNAQIFLWGTRISVLFLIFFVVFYQNNKSKQIFNDLNNTDNFFKNRQTKIIKYLNSLSTNDFFKLFKLDEKSSYYLKTKELLLQTGNPKGLTVEVVQNLRVIVPIITFILCIIFLIIMRTINFFTIKQSIQSTNQAISSFIIPIVSNETFKIITLKHIVLILLIPIISIGIPDIVLKYKAKKRTNQIKEEINIIETFIIIMLQTENFGVYEILKILNNSNNIIELKPILECCLNEYCINSTNAIQSMSNKIQNEEFQVVCNTLKNALDKDNKYIAKYLKDNLDQLKRFQKYEIEKEIKRKPYIYVFVLAIPLFNIMLIWLYPWVMKVLNLLNNFNTI